MFVAVSDMEVYSRMQTVVIFPLTTADIYNDTIRKQTEAASSVELTLEDTVPGNPPKGSVMTRFIHLISRDTTTENYRDRQTK